MAGWLHAESAEREIVNIMKPRLAVLAGKSRPACRASSGRAARSYWRRLELRSGPRWAIRAVPPNRTSPRWAIPSIERFRLESATKEAGWDVALGEDTYGLIGSLGNVRDIFQPRMLQLKGYAEPVTAWGARFEGTLLPALDPIRGDNDATPSPSLEASARARSLQQCSSGGGSDMKPKQTRAKPMRLLSGGRTWYSCWRARRRQAAGLIGNDYNGVLYDVNESTGGGFRIPEPEAGIVNLCGIALLFGERNALRL